MFSKLLNFLTFLSFVCMSTQLNLAEFGESLDCQSVSLSKTPRLVPNPCAYVSNITSLIDKFSPSNQVLTKKMITSLFSEIKLKAAESFKTVKQKNSGLFSEFASKDPIGSNATEILFANLASNKKALSLSVDECDNYKSDIDALQSKLNPDGIRINKQIACLIASDMKKNLPVTMAVFLFKNGKSLSLLEKSESANLEPFKDLMLQIMARKNKD